MVAPAAGAAAASRLLAVRRGVALALTTWSSASLGAAGLLAVLGRRRPRLRGAARQTAAWGAVDLAIAVAAHRGAEAPVEDPVEATRALRRLLLLNAGLDVGYVAAGLLLARRGRVRGRDVVGDGAAVVVQGAFLLALDTVAASRLRLP
ncbi:DUF6992 family protein [Aquipuribacter nitratireducens]|uniref:DUF6992 family protein n=1 Tax=Aquipuribacter nitratireducens TaxID=650104 RepID=A0ABW0GM06_9MICO